jgi:hypothetical protein
VLFEFPTDGSVTKIVRVVYIKSGAPYGNYIWMEISWAPIQTLHTAPIFFCTELNSPSEVSRSKWAGSVGLSRMYTDANQLGPETIQLAGQAVSEKWEGLTCERLYISKKPPIAPQRKWYCRIALLLMYMGLG